MILTLLKKTVALLLTAFLILLLLLAVYVSLGRQLLPYIDKYHGEIESQLSAQLGQKLQFGNIEGSWSRFNPILRLHDVTIVSTRPSGDELLLQLDTLSLELNAWASLARRRLLLASIDIDKPEFTLEESPDGRWQLFGFESDPSVALDADQALDLVSRVSDLTLSNLQLTLRRANGQSRVFERSRLRIQNRSEQHYLHLDVWQKDVIGPLSIAAELSGDRVEDLNGMLYVLLPDTDYSEMLSRDFGDDVSLTALEGNAEMWVSVNEGQLDSVQGNIELARLAMELPHPYAVENLSTRFYLQRQDAEQDWKLWLERFAFSWNEMQWEPSDLYVDYAAGEHISLAANKLNLGVSTGMLGASSLLDATANEQLLGLNPRGELENLDLEVLLGDGGIDAARMRLVANLNDVAMSALAGAPSIWGIDGYTELTFDMSQKRLTGFADVDSQRLMFQLPTLFNDVWAYDRINGRVSVDLDVTEGLLLNLSSSVIEAESDVVSGHAQFSLFTRKAANIDTIANLELKVGIDRGDISQKAIYLPTAPEVKDGLRSLMTWLDGAILDGTAVASGLIFRGSVLPNSNPNMRTLQMLFNVENGTLRFDSQWPVLDSLNGHVIIADRNVDISVNSGQSRGIGFESTIAAIRPNEAGSGNWLTVTGAGAGEAQQALRYLQETPVTRGFGNYIADWQGQGEVDLALDLRIPLGIPSSEPEVTVGLQLRDDTLYIPEFELHFDAVSGALQYNTSTGLGGQGISANLFEEAVSVNLLSSVDSERTTNTRVEIEGAVEVPQLRAWPKQSGFVVDMLERTSGHMNYMALLEISQPAASADQDSAAEAGRRLTIDSKLEGIEITYPAPFKKDTGISMPMHMTIDFLETRQDLRVTLGDITSVNIGLNDGQVRSGLVFLGKQKEGVSIRRLNANAPGLDVLGTLQHFDYEEWMLALSGTDSVNSLGSSSANFSSLRNIINAVDVTISDAYAFGQNAKDLNVQIASEEQYWKLSLAGATVEGEVQVPYVSGTPLEVNFDRLVFPVVEATVDSLTDFDLELQGPPPAQDSYWLRKERVDVLADVDPRNFPYMHFKAADVRRGEADYGSWQFTIEPNASGAVFSDLLVETRGVRAGKLGEEGRFMWTYDGRAHHSYFSSLLEAGNLATVLSNFGYAPSLESSNAEFFTSVDWAGSPAFFSVDSLSGDVELKIFEGRFLQSNAGAANGALKLISIINFDALVRRLRFSDDLLRRGLSYEQINGSLSIDDGIVDIVDRLQIIGPASLFQVSGQLDLAQQTIDGNLYITLPLSDNIPWMSGIAVLNNLINWQVAVGVFLFDQIFGDQVDSLTSAQYTLKGPWDSLEPKLNQVFGTPGAPAAPPGTGGAAAANAQGAQNSGSPTDEAAAPDNRN